MLEPGPVCVFVLDYFLIDFTVCASKLFFSDKSLNMFGWEVRGESTESACS